MSDFLADAVLLFGLVGVYTATAITASVVMVAAGMKVREVWRGR